MKAGRRPREIVYHHAPCVQCGGEVLRAYKERYAQWFKRRFCSKPCWYAHKRGTPHHTAAAIFAPDCFSPHNIATRDGGAIKLGRAPSLTSPSGLI